MKDNTFAGFGFIAVALMMFVLLVSGNAAAKFAQNGGVVHFGDEVHASTQYGDAIAVAGKNNAVETNAGEPVARNDSTSWLAVWYVLLLLGGSIYAVARLLRRGKVWQ